MLSDIIRGSRGLNIVAKISEIEAIRRTITKLAQTVDRQGEGLVQMQNQILALKGVLGTVIAQTAEMTPKEVLAFFREADSFARSSNP
jgi:hypothetical protein